MKSDAVIANCITGSRILFSLLLLSLSPNTLPFAAFYLLCGVTDVLDGFVARKLHTESKAGERLDSRSMGTMNRLTSGWKELCIQGILDCSLHEA